jgi:hypothetical protein
MIPAGPVPVRVLQGDKLLISREVVLLDGDEYVFQPAITTTLEVVLTGGRIATGTCKGLDYPAADGGTD